MVKEIIEKFHLNNTIVEKVYQKYLSSWHQKRQKHKHDTIMHKVMDAYGLEALKIIKHMKEIYANKDYTNLYCNNMVLDIYPELDIHVKEIKGIYEIDTPEELKEVELKLNEK